MLSRKYAVITAEGKVKTKDERVPALQEGEALIKVDCSLISPGTEIAMIKSRRENAAKEGEDIAFGYACAGEIIELKTSSSCGLTRGMRVAAMGAGYALHANYACVPVNLISPLPDNVSFEDATYACLGATALQAIYRTDIKLGEYGIIAGLGIVGNLAAQLAQIAGGRVIAWETLDSRIDIAKKCGIRNILNVKTYNNFIEQTNNLVSPYGADFAIIAFGGDGSSAFSSILKCMKTSADGHRMGRITIVGGCRLSFTGAANCGNIDIRSSARTGPGYHDKTYEHGKNYPDGFVQFTTQRNLKEIIALISENRLSVKPLTTHRIPLEDVANAVDMLIETPDSTIGVVLKMTGTSSA